MSLQKPTNLKSGPYIEITFADGSITYIPVVGSFNGKTPSETHVPAEVDYGKSLAREWAENLRVSTPASVRFDFA